MKVRKSSMSRWVRRHHPRTHRICEAGGRLPLADRPRYRQARRYPTQRTLQDERAVCEWKTKRQSMLEKRRRMVRDHFREQIGAVGTPDPGAYQGASGSDAGTRKQLSVIAETSFRRFRPSQALRALQLLSEGPRPVVYHATGGEILEIGRTAFVNWSCFFQGQRIIVRRSHGCFEIAYVPCPREN